MREIKFKAWDFENNIMIDADSFYFSDEFEPFVSQFMSARLQFEIMQFVGLEDKNSKEIYEDDIVEVDTTGINYRNDRVKGVVKFIDGCFTVVFKNPVYDKFLGCMRNSHYVKCFVVNHAIEVIGNVHETPELLQKDA